MIALWCALAFAGDFDDGLRVERGAMGTLASWSIGNLAVGVPAGLQSEGRSRGFWLGNAAWNGVNLGIVGLGAAGIHGRVRAGDPGPVALARQQRALRRTLLVNAGLDVAYVATGLALRSLAERDDLRGMGDALVLQGGFLLVFDSTFLAVHHSVSGRRRGGR
ncbi:MAG: hypothetical protein EP330_13530 [Deltaproteobacteria bacterium]|nr:MAG: hypothetical protein EP330_13530 [Deltaproteobacteria bacterium]